MWYFYEDPEDEEEQVGGVDPNADNHVAYNEEEQSDDEEQDEKNNNNDGPDRRDKKDKKDDKGDEKGDEGKGDDSKSNDGKGDKGEKSGENSGDGSQPSKQSQDVADQMQQGKNNPSSSPGGEGPGGGPGSGAAPNPSAGEGVANAAEGVANAGEGAANLAEGGSALAEAGTGVAETGAAVGESAVGATAVTSGGAAVTTGGAAVTSGGAAVTTGGAAVGTAAAGGTAVAGGTAAAGTVTAAAGTAAAAWPVALVLLIILLIIVIIIIAVGLVCFFIFMPGQVVEKLKSLGVEFLDTVQAFAEGKQNVVHGEEIADVAQYIERMGYDLKGEGFITDDIKNYPGSSQPSNSKYDEEQGVYRDNDTDAVLSIYSDPIKTYIVSDNLCYLVKNANGNIADATASNPLYVIGSVISIVAGFIVSPVIGLAALFTFVALNGGNPAWGSGLISIYHEGSDIGKRGDFYRDIETGFISLDPKTKKLKIKRGWTNNAYEFDVDGWSGRYGMPLEFLLSVHVATQMPDLAMDIATSFDTDVEVLLHEVNGGEITSGFFIGSDPSSVSDGDIVTWDDVIEIVENDDSDLAQGILNVWNGAIDWLGGWLSFIQTEKLQAFTVTDRNYIELFEAGLPHADDCSCCSHIPGSKGGEEEEDCEDDTDHPDVDESDVLGDHTICNSCKNYISKIISALRYMEDKNWNSYTPYIARVQDHWFRDVYFVIEDIDNTNVAIVDEEYYYQTNERWTVYETWQEGESMPEGYEVGDYKLYEYYTTEGSGGSLVEHYELSNASKKEAEEINEAIANGDTSKNRLVKKLVTQKISDIKDAEGNAMIQGVNGNRWVAYESGVDQEIDWTKMEISDETAEVLQEFDGQLYYKESRPGDITQIEDGQRGETNPKIKKMFVENKYYQYDGTKAKADQITEDKKKHPNVDSFARTAENADEKLLGKVSITKDSLTAFSMLENTHTLDADYIYKDFKELIVELNYFDKEELSDKIAKVMHWPVPETGIVGWPIRKYEKSDIFYGTLINSMVDMTLLRQADIEAAEAELAKLKEEDGSDPSALPSITPTGKVASGSVSDLVDKGYEVHKVMEDDGNWDYCIISQSQYGTQHMRAACPDPKNCGKQHCDTKNGSHTCGLNATIAEAKANYHNTCCATFVSWALKEAGFDLSNHPNMHGAQASYEWCKAEGWTPITSYEEMEPGDLLFNHGSSTSDIGHVQMLGNNGEWLNGGGVADINRAPYAYDPSSFIIAMRSQMQGNKELFKGYKPNEPVVSPLTGKVLEFGTVKRTNVETGEEEEVEFIKIEAMNKYIYNVGSSPKNSGKGYTECKDPKEDTFKKKASDKAKKLEGYDYFYDEYSGVLDGYVLYMEGFDLTLFDLNEDNPRMFAGKTTYSSGDIDTSKYTGPDGSLNMTSAATDESKIQSMYIPNEVYPMVDDLEEARDNWKEDAKAEALPLLEINGELYIKEGTVIGKTLEDPDDMSDIEIRTIVDSEGNEINSCAGNGNYIRLILRNLDDSVVEDVENYLPIEDGKNSSEVEFEQLAYFLGCLEEGFYKNKDLGDSYGIEVLNDGAGNTTAFGLTSAVYDTVKDTWPSFKQHLEAGEVPKEEAQDVFILVLEAAKEAIEKKANSELEDNYMFALIDLRHASPVECDRVVDIFNSNGTLTVEDFENHWGSNMNYRDGLMRRGHNRGILATEGRFLLYQAGSEGDEVIFETETPWTEFCDGGGTYELTRESSGFYRVEKGADNWTVPPQ